MTEDPRPAAPSHLRCPLSIFHVAAAAAAMMTGLLVILEPRLALWPLVLIVLACFVAPFIPRLGFFLPVITRGDRTRPAAALTFDDGPDPVTTPLLLDLLARRGARAAFFLIGEKAEHHPDLVRAILAAGHEIGNHSYSHDVFLMLRGRARLKREIARSQDVLRVFGIRPLVFRPPVGITNPLLYGTILEAGMTCVCFRRRPADFGNRRLTGLSTRLTRRLTAGDILLLHEGLPPRAEGGTGPWLAEIEGVLDALAGKGLRAALLSEVIRQPVLESAAPAAGEAPDSVRLFYEGLAGLYDDEQDAGAASRLRRSEREAVLARIGGLLSPADSVLEIGAGTGRFTLLLARAAGRVTAVDLSEGMLRVLEGKARAAGLSGITVIRGDAGRLSFEATFDAVCAFSSLEYFRDLSGLLGRLHACLKPGGLLYFTLARRSFLRIFGQIGNAMRQGVWLRAYGRRGLGRILHRAGFRPVEIRPFGLKSILSGGILWEVAARRDDAVPPSLRD